MPSVAGITDYFSRGEREREKRRGGGVKKKGGRKKMKEGKEGGGRGKGGKKKEKELHWPLLYWDPGRNISRRFQVVVVVVSVFRFSSFFFFFSTFRPGKILPRAQRTARRMRTNLCEFLNPLPPPSIILELLYSFFLSFFYVGLRLRPIDTIRAVDYYSVDRLDWNVYWKISI